MGKRIYQVVGELVEIDGTYYLLADKDGQLQAKKISLDLFQKKITVSATEPVSPVEGDFWYDIS